MKNQENETHSQEKRVSTETDPEITQVDKGFKAAIITILNELKQNILTIMKR